MSENLLQLISGLKLLLVAGFAMLYGMGGISGKWKRRFIAPVVYVAGICGFSLWTGSWNTCLCVCNTAYFRSATGLDSLGFTYIDLCIYVGRGRRLEPDIFSKG